ncbi:hypothetical protein AAW51_4238 [Caldimonas brevitalea]|uniref:Uncharacterized protein n=1 Tax=Caldimonas brevitalea TaxID=413882 RepID=A0A0G3BNA0_9BURK|nr:hypothetical protein AAW51_4238 [Caldimonas brevitalea]
MVEAVIELVLIGTGRVAVRVVSLGRWRGAAFDGNEERIFSAAGALSFRKEGRRIITSTGLLFAGVLAYLILFAVLVAAA